MVEDVKTAMRNGRFEEALALLERVRVTTDTRIEADVNRMELLEHVGQHSACRVIADRLLRNSRLPPSYRSACEFCLGLISWNEGRTEAASLHLQKAVAAAESANDLARTCWTQLRLMVARVGQSDPQIVVPLLAQLRWNVLKLGDPLVTAALHLHVGGMEARRGLVRSARRHMELGRRLLDTYENPWLESIAEVNLTGIALMACDFEEGMSHAVRALALAEECGDVTIRRACLGNLGNLYCEAGQFDRMVEHFELATAALPSSGEFLTAANESVVRALLLQGEIDRAVEHLERTCGVTANASDQLLYANRHAQLTRAWAMALQGRLDEAVRAADVAFELATKTGDQLLMVLARIARFEFEPAVANSGIEPLPTCSVVAKRLYSSPPDVHARYERALACQLARVGRWDQAASHFRRALRVYEGLHSVPGVIDLNRVWQLVTSSGKEESTEPLCEARPPGTSSELIQDISALMMHSGRAELIARDLVAILAESGSVDAASAITRAEDGTVETLAAHGHVETSTHDTNRVFPLGTARGRQVEVVVRPLPDLEALATLHAISMLLDTVRELERAQTEREQQLTLWPVDELPVDGDEAIISGRMREIMTFAQRVARTNASVLITGESGTGKEIVARAVHAHSTRASRPFMPFNCTAVPRDMLESQLFGHRRGAFTGADRDYAGLVRAAREGTLFLDEIGEMGLDLQPKLLRFLESGEISPLGEPGPLTVNVRIVAATNANLDELVQRGRFREDLFYRLNVIRLMLPPLRERRDEIPALIHHFVARAAAEFAKSRVRMAEETMDHLLLYDWPGNVRQLQNEVRRMVALVKNDANDAVVTPDLLSPEVKRATSRTAARSAPGGLAFSVAPGEKLTPALNRIERELIRAALRASQGRVDAAAKALGISRKGLYLKRQRLGL